MAVKSFVWNFSLNVESLAAIKELDLSAYAVDPKLKWERRFFWQEEDEITLVGLPESFLNFDEYRFKKRHDCYILNIPNHRNVKIRNQKIANKPLLIEENNLFGYAKKEKFAFEAPESQAIVPELTAWDSKIPIQSYLSEYYTLVPTYKEAFIYTLCPDLKARFELTRIKLGTKHYFSFCVEAKNKALVQRLSDTMAPNQIAKDYLQFIEEVR